MKIEKILFVGLGGAGQRHLRVFHSLLGESAEYWAFRQTRKTPLLAPDFTVVDGQVVEEKFALRAFSDLDQALEAQPDLVVISNPTNMHLTTALRAVSRSAHVFVEKPLVGTIADWEMTELERAVKEKQLAFFLSFQRRFHPYIRELKSFIQNGELGKISSVQVSVSSYVPEWHPYENWRDMYACRSDLGGGALLTECHEIDLILWLFGCPQYITCSTSVCGSFPLEVEDTYMMHMEYPAHSVLMDVSYMRRPVERTIKIYGSEAYVKVEMGEESSLEIVRFSSSGMDRKYRSASISNETIFKLQAEYFLEHFDCRESGRVLEEARNLGQLFEAARESSRTRRAIAFGSE